MGGMSVDYDAVIIPSPIKQVIIDDFRRTEGDKRDVRSRWNFENEELEHYYAYYTEPSEITVILQNNKEYSGGIWTVKNSIEKDEGVKLSYPTIVEENEQTPSNIWTPGTYKCTMIFAGVSGDYNVIIEPAAAGIPGDVNMDTKVNFQDVTTLLKHVKKKPLDKVDLKAVDVDGNGKVNFQDVTVLLKYVKKKVNTIYYDGNAYTR